MGTGQGLGDLPGITYYLTRIHHLLKKLMATVILCLLSENVPIE
jgi:hypothetical protein